MRKFSASSGQNVHLMSSLYPIMTKDTFVAKVWWRNLNWNSISLVLLAHLIAVMYASCQIRSRASGKTLVYFSWLGILWLHFAFTSFWWASLLGVFDFKKALMKDSCSLQFSGILSRFFLNFSRALGAEGRCHSMECQKANLSMILAFKFCWWQESTRLFLYTAIWFFIAALPYLIPILFRLDTSN